MNVLIACDHAAIDLKYFLIDNLQNEYHIKDLGCFDKKSVDYPDIAGNLCKELTDNSKEEYQFGILICGSGIGVSIAANKFKDIRAALCTNGKMAELARNHNNANILCLGARIIDQNTALACCQKFLTSSFNNGRHLNRINKIKND